MRTSTIHKIFLVILFSLFGAKGWSQDTNSNEISITDLEIPNAPALSVLDASNTVIETPKNIKALTSSLINNLGNNFAIEVTPYFFLKKNKNYYDFNGYKIVEDKYIEKGALSAIYPSFSVSIASVKKDSANYLSFGMRTNLLKIKNRKQTEIFVKAEKLYNEKIYPLYTNSTPEELQKSEEYKKASKEYNDVLDVIIKPLVSIDVAAAYSQFYLNNSYSNEFKGKSGAWVTISYNYLLNSNDEKNFQYLSIYALGRYLNDKNHPDSTTNEFKEKNQKDLGGKVELELDNFSFAYEYIKRASEKDNYRSVGTIKYKISNDIVLNGGFGKNFEKTDNLVTFLGINWGVDLDKNSFTKD